MTIPNPKSLSNAVPEDDLGTPETTALGTTAVEEHPRAEAKFLGHKERRKSSSTKLFLGDYLNLTAEPAIQRILCKNGDLSISFSDIVIKVNKRNKMQDRILLLTDKALYNIEPGSFKLKRRIGLESIGDLKMSKLPDNFFCIHVPTEYDYLMASSKKIEIVTKLSENYERLLKQPLIMTFSNCFTYRIDRDSYREIQFSVVEGGISTQIFSKKKGK